ncbi:MAG: hypothetical protein LC104_20820 [Bacteroidales bacterium]|nr:hypothetical protein [Bacteroidales bacterium]
MKLAYQGSTNPLTRAFIKPFPPKDVKWKPQAVKGNRALAIAYLDARAIQDRLDEVVGVEGWQDEYQLLPDGSVVCKLQLLLNGHWVSKTDVGSPSEQPDNGDRMKAAFSDALKRAAVKFGIGRYLYRIPAQWVDYDPVKKQLLQTPKLPTLQPEHQDASTQSIRPTNSLPVDGTELLRRLNDFDARLTAQNRCAPGEVLREVMAAGTAAGYDPEIATWTGPAIVLAVETVKAMDTRLRMPINRIAESSTT